MQNLNPSWVWNNLCEEVSLKIFEQWTITNSMNWMERIFKTSHQEKYKSQARVVMK